MGGVFTRLLVFSLLCAVNLFLLAMLGIVRLLPAAVPFILRALATVLVLSRRLFVRLLTQAAPLIKRSAAIDISQGLWRLTATCLLSLLLGGLLLLLLGWGINIWTILLLIGHGIFVDLTWEQAGESGGIEMGERMPWNH